jgi:hypothetical protein
VIEAQFDYASAFTASGLARIKFGASYGFVDKNGKYVINPTYEDATSFSASGTALVKTGGKWGVIDKTGAFLLEAKYNATYTNTNFTSLYDDGYVFLKDGEVICLFDAKGKEILRIENGN